MAVELADIEFFAWLPKANKILVGDHLNAVQRRGALALGLAHQQLQHRGNALAHDVEARSLAVSWLVTPDLFAEATRAVGIDPWDIAAHLEVTPNTIRVYLGWVCGHTSNHRLFAGDVCRCAGVGPLIPVAVGQN